MATTTSSHVTRVLRTVAPSFAVISAALLSGRVAMNGVSSYEPLPPALGLLTVAATNAATIGGVSSTTTSARRIVSGGIRTRAASFVGPLVIATRCYPA